MNSSTITYHPGSFELKILSKEKWREKEVMFKFKIQYSAHNSNLACNWLNINLKKMNKICLHNKYIPILINHKNDENELI